MTDHHDQLVKAVFGEPTYAAKLIAAALPHAVTSSLDLERLGPIATETVDDALSNRRADLVFETTAEGAPAFIHIEHQSSPDPLISLRILRYQLRQWEVWERSKASLPMPGAFSLVLYNGRTPWRPPPLVELMPRWVSERATATSVAYCWADTAILHHRATLPGLAGVAISALYAGTRARLPLADTLAPSLVALAETPSNSRDLHVFGAILQYVCSVRPTHDPDLVPSLLRLLPAQYKTMAFTTWDYIQQQARDEGIEIGEQRGIEIGEQRGIEIGEQRAGERARAHAQREMAQRLLSEGLDAELVARVTGLALELVQGLGDDEARGSNES